MKSQLIQSMHDMTNLTSMYFGVSKLDPDAILQVPALLDALPRLQTLDIGINEQGLSGMITLPAAAPAIAGGAQPPPQRVPAKTMPKEWYGMTLNRLVIHQPNGVIPKLHCPNLTTLHIIGWSMTMTDFGIASSAAAVASISLEDGAPPPTVTHAPLFESWSLLPNLKELIISKRTGVATAISNDCRYLYGRPWLYYNAPQLRDISIDVTSLRCDDLVTMFTTWGAGLKRVNIMMRHSVPPSIGRVILITCIKQLEFLRLVWNQETGATPDDDPTAATAFDHILEPYQRVPLESLHSTRSVKQRHIHHNLAEMEGTRLDGAILTDWSIPQLRTLSIGPSQHVDVSQFNGLLSFLTFTPLLRRLCLLHHLPLVLPPPYDDHIHAATGTTSTLPSLPSLTSLSSSSKTNGNRSSSSHTSSGARALHLPFLEQLETNVPSSQGHTQLFTTLMSSCYAALNRLAIKRADRCSLSRLIGVPANQLPTQLRLLVLDEMTSELTHAHMSGVDATMFTLLFRRLPQLERLKVPPTLVSSLKAIAAKITPPLIVDITTTKLT
jgi:hypothetical protein